MQPMGNMVKSGQQMNERGEYADFFGGTWFINESWISQLVSRIS